MSGIDVYKMIEELVIAQMENGIIPWRRCYHLSNGSQCVSHQTGQSYSFLNQFFLGEPGEYWTFEAAKKSGHSIRKGSKAKKVFFFKVLNFKEENKDGEEVIRGVPMLKYYNVFHESDIEGLPVKELDGIDEEKRRERNSDSIPEAEEIIRNYLSGNEEITMITADRTPCFSPASKTIYIPEKCQFDSLAEYYSTAFHEIIHSTKEMVKRDVTSYAREELVAEIGAAYLCGKCGIFEEELIKNNAAYCANWLTKIRKDIKGFVWAASKAERAAKYVIGETAEKEASEQ